MGKELPEIETEFPLRKKTSKTYIKGETKHVLGR